MEDRDFGREIDSICKRVDGIEKSICGVNEYVNKIDKRYAEDIAKIETKLSYMEQNLGSINANVRWVLLILIGAILTAVLNLVII